ncbi:MAG: hypothetical protein SFV22_05430 [Saprospiraceae bacterium]|nr:hypothetical protein [Saprospiraceae bacterium]
MHTLKRSLLFIPLLLLSCRHEPETRLVELDYLIFGHSYGECAGETCVEIFQLRDGVLYEDTSLFIQSNAYQFTPLDNDKYLLVKDLPEYLPTQLLQSESATFGCPDCGDQGALIIQISENGQEKTWFIDQFKGEVPEYLHPFMNKVNEKIALLQ